MKPTKMLNSEEKNAKVRWVWNLICHPMGRTYSCACVRSAKFLDLKEKEVESGSIKLHNDEFHSLHLLFTLYWITTTNSRSIGWAVHLARMCQMTSSYTAAVRKPGTNSPLGRHRSRWYEYALIRILTSKYGKCIMDSSGSLFVFSDEPLWALIHYR
jgi:hypothetical protein